MSRKHVWILFATILGSSMAFIDASVVNVALPSLQSAFNASTTSVQWVVESYALFLGALLLVGGSLGDRYGRKRIFALGVVLFAAASAWCGFAVDITHLIIARAFQGIGGALLTPGSLAILRDSFAEAQRGKAIGLWSGFSAITSALGPVIGGFLVQHASWRWIFFINIPLAIIVLILLFWHVPESYAKQEEHQALDIPGALCVTVGLGAIVFGLIESNGIGVPNPLVLACIGGGILFLIVFVFVEKYSVSPMMPLHLFHSRTFCGANVLTFFLYAALGGTLFFLPFNLIQVQDYSTTEAGAALLPFTLLVFSLSRWSGGLVEHYGPRLPLIVGPFITGIGYALFALPGVGGNYWTTYFPAIIVLGFGMSITVAPLTTTVLGAVEDRYAGVASGLNNAVARIAGLLAIAVFGIIVLAVFSTVLDQRLAALSLSPEVMAQIQEQRVKLAGIEIPMNVNETTHRQLQQAIAEAFVTGFRLLMCIGASLALISAICAFLLIKKTDSTKQSKKVPTEYLCGDNAGTLTHVHTQVVSQSLQVDTMRERP